MKPGIWQIDADKYHRDPTDEPSLSNSIAQILLEKSPLHAWCAHPRLNPNYKPNDDAKFDVGNAAHAFLLEGLDKMEAIDPTEYPAKNGNVPDGWTNKAIREARDAARAAGKIPVLLSVAQDIRQMVDTAKAFVATSEIAGAFDTGRPEQTVIWKDGKVWCRARPDWMSSDCSLILDYKTTTDAAPEVFSRQLVRMGYHRQAYFYGRGVNLLTDKMPKFVFLVQEASAPYACSLAACSPMLHELAGDEIVGAIDLWEECLKSGKWPAYSPRIAWAEPPAWLFNKQEAE